jgi:hypothetical protein
VPWIPAGLASRRHTAPPFSRAGGTAFTSRSDSLRRDQVWAVTRIL